MNPRAKEDDLTHRIEIAAEDRRKLAEEEARRVREEERRPLAQRISYLENRLSTLESYVRSLAVKTKDEVAAEEQKESCLRVRKSLLTDREALFVRGPWNTPEVWAVPLPAGYYAPDASSTYVCQRRGTYTLHLCDVKDIESGRYVVLGVVT